MSAIDRTASWASTITDVVDGLTNGRPLRRFAEEVRDTYEPGIDDPWWYDNTAHFLSGVIIGTASMLMLGTGMIGSTVVFLGLAAVWEYFEYSYGIRPWDEREDWSYDRAVEDTMLDTVAGLAGVIVVVMVL